MLIHVIEQAIAPGTRPPYEHHFCKQDRLSDEEEVKILAINDRGDFALLGGISDRQPAQVQLQHTHPESIRATRLKF